MSPMHCLGIFHRVSNFSVHFCFASSVLGFINSNLVSTGVTCVGVLIQLFKPIRHQRQLIWSVPDKN